MLAQFSVKEGIIMKVTFLSKWTVLLFTITTGLLLTWSYSLLINPLQIGSWQLGDAAHPGWGIFVVFLALVVYGLGWVIALSDAIQERKWTWAVFLVILLPLWVGPLFYGFMGPRNTR
jgi:hypothetical protein